MRLWLLLLTAALATLPCCAGSQRSAVPPGEHAASPAAETSSPAENAALRLVYEGTWRSPACGLRNHDQVLKLAGDGSFHLEDRISPCPQKSACIWSGIETMDGRWQLDGDAIDLLPSKDVPAIARPPTRLHWRTPPAGTEAPAGALEDQRGCLFLREEPKPPGPAPAATSPEPTPEAPPSPAPAQPSATSAPGPSTPSPAPAQPSATSAPGTSTPSPAPAQPSATSAPGTSAPTPATHAPPPSPGTPEPPPTPTP